MGVLDYFGRHGMWHRSGRRKCGVPLSMAPPWGADPLKMGKACAVAITFIVAMIPVRLGRTFPLCTISIPGGRSWSPNAGMSGAVQKGVGVLFPVIPVGVGAGTGTVGAGTLPLPCVAI